MKKEHIMDAMDYIDPALIAAADGSAHSRGGKRWVRAALIAACLCLAMVGTVGAAQFLGVTVDLQSNPNWPDSNYTVTGGIAFFPVDSFPQQVQDMAVPHKMTGKNFTSWAQMEEFLGRKLPNSTALESARPGPTVKVEGARGGTHVLLALSASEEGIVSVNADAFYVLDGIVIEQSAGLYTDKTQENHMKHSPEGSEFNGGTVRFYEEGSSITEEMYTTPGGLTATIVCVTPPAESQRPITEYNAHFSINGIQCMVRAATDITNMAPVDVSAAENPAHTLEVLKQVLDGFVLD